MMTTESHSRTLAPGERRQGQARFGPRDYARLYARSTSENEDFWAEQAACIDWAQPFQKVKDVSFCRDDLHIRWYGDGLLNVCENCVDRHLPQRGDKTAILWQGDRPGEVRYVTYNELHRQVCRLANGLRDRGVEPGDRVVIYMPMVPEAVYAMLACARMGAVHSVVFGGFSANALADRIVDCGAKAIITADAGLRGGKLIALKVNVDEALTRPGTERVQTVVVLERSGADIDWQSGRDIWYHQLVAGSAEQHDAVTVGAEHPLFVLYTSGSTGKPKGLQHSSGGYLVYAATTFRYLFDYREDDIYWCTADIGWITGHSYVVYGPLANGATTMLFEGVPNYPDLGRFGQLIDLHRVSLFYTAPTAVRTLMSDAATALGSSERQSLRIVACAGEPINPDVWRWYHDEFGNGNCPVIDTWWQTETGGVMIAPFPDATLLKPGSATKPFFGIEPQLVDANSDILAGASDGHLVILDSWPGQARTIWGDHQRFIDTYFRTHPGMYFTGDGARRDEDGYYWITGRVDDVLNVSGHRLGTAEIESAVVSHPAVAEAAVVGFPHPIKGEAIYIYATVVAGVEPGDALSQELRRWVRKELGPVATPDLIQWTAALPKTRSGKIMRRILRKIAADDFASLGDTSTLAEPWVVDELVQGRLNRG